MKVIVVGAGMAGLAAAEALTRRGAEVVVLEARARTGGRAVTDSTSFEGLPFDLGASWLNAPEQNPLAARLEGLKDIPGDKITILDGKRFNRAQAREFDGLLESIRTAIDASAEGGLQLSRLRAQDLTEHLAMSLIGANTFGIEMNELDALDAALNIKAGGGQYAPAGMGKAITQLFREIPVRLNTPVTKIAYDDGVVNVTTRQGDTLTADAAIVTVSTGVLASGKIDFFPVLPSKYSEAITNLPMGLVNRIALEFTTDIFGDAVKPMTQLRAVTSSGQVIDATLKAGDDKLIVFNVGGNLARDLERQSDSASLNYALGGLVDLFGSNVETAFVRGKTSRWGVEPWTLGSFTVATPRKSRAREVLAEPLGSLAFAGEALGGPWARTLAGAYLSGREAATKLLG